MRQLVNLSAVYVEETFPNTEFTVEFSIFEKIVLFLNQSHEMVCN